MLLKVGELARSTGLTVRTLHHYDEIGLLKPSGRSEAGYRLYADADVARLHAIQALRYLGLALADIGPVLDGQHASVEAILEQQMQALKHQISQATELHARLSLLREGILHGKQPLVDDWVQSLSLMATYGKYFSAEELQGILRGFLGIEQEWAALTQEVRVAMDEATAIDTPRAQALAWRWMTLVHRWMGGDIRLIDRWGAMYRQEPSAHGRRGSPPTDMIKYIESAIALRMELLNVHFGESFRKVRAVPLPQWRAIQEEALRLLGAGKPAGCAEARALARRWFGLLEQAAGSDPDLIDKLRRMHEGHPLLLAGNPISREVREFLVQALDPHAT